MSAEQAVRYKKAADRSVPKRFGYTCDDIATEYAALEQLYEAAPEHVPEPLDPVYENGEMTGYGMEEIDGQEIGAYLTGDQDIRDLPVDEITTQVDDVVDRFHEHDLVHGDIRRDNVLVTPDYDIVFIDPAGVPPDAPILPQMKRHDRQQSAKLQATIDRVAQRYGHT